MTARTPAPRWRGWLLVALVLPVAGAVFYEAQRLFRADWASAATRHNVVQWVSGKGAPQSQAEWDAALADLQTSLRITPDDPNLHERLGDLHAVAGQRDWADDTLRRAHFARAATAYEQATVLRPSEPGTWAMLAIARQAMGAGGAPVHSAWARARALGPFEGHVQPMLMQVVLADWDGATPEMQAWAKALFDAGNANMRKDINTMANRYGLRFAPDPAPASASAPTSASASAPATASAP